MFLVIQNNESGVAVAFVHVVLPSRDLRNFMQLFPYFVAPWFHLNQYCLLVRGMNLVNEAINFVASEETTARMLKRTQHGYVLATGTLKTGTCE